MVIMENLLSTDMAMILLFLYGLASDIIGQIPKIKANSIPALVRDFVMGGINGVMSKSHG